MNNDAATTQQKIVELTKKHTECLEQIEDLVEELEVEDDPELAEDLQLSIEIEELTEAILREQIEKLEDKFAQLKVREIHMEIYGEDIA